MHDVSSTSVHAPVLESNVSFSTTLSNSRGQPDGDGVTEGDGGVSEGDGDGMVEEVPLEVVVAENDGVSDREPDTVSVAVPDAVNDGVSVREPDKVVVAEGDGAAEGDAVSVADPDGEWELDLVADSVAVGVVDTQMPMLTEICALSIPRAAMLVDSAKLLTMSTVSVSAVWSIRMEMVRKKSRP